MTATYMHIGIPITEKKPNMIYNEAMKFVGVERRTTTTTRWSTSSSRRARPSPKSCIVAGTWPTRWTIWTGTSTMPTASSATPWTRVPGVRLAFVEKDGAVIELYEDKN